ncbi:immunoglobulin lambda-1 light chain [Amia ocellicauda]|uniref:immunoglobulin lambda-1 light chain n=1 Tax=Amia ocellicauda TaxID=2972642 RepID=UPI0034646257
MKMLGLLCCLAVWLRCVQSQAVTQPGSLSVRIGQTATLHCNVGVDENGYMSWFKQTPGEKPQFIFRFYHSHSAPDAYGTGFSSSRFTAKATDSLNYQLLISSVESSDTAVYHCANWRDSGDRFVFGQGTKLTVQGDAGTLPKPTVSILPPSADELTKGTATLLCLANRISVPFVDVSWMADGKQVSTGVGTSVSSKGSDGFFGVSSFLTLPVTEWSSGPKVYSCAVQQTGWPDKDTAQIRKSDCGV